MRKYVGKEAKEARKFGKLTWRCYICGDSCKIYSAERRAMSIVRSVKEALMPLKSRSYIMINSKSTSIYQREVAVLRC